MQLPKPSQVRKENVFFSESKTDEHGNEIIKIQTMYDSCSETTSAKPGPLVIETPFLSSFGVERKSQKTDELVGYNLPVCLWSWGEEPTPEQNQFFNCLTLIQHACYEYLEETYDSDVSERLSEILYYIHSLDEHGKRKKRDESFPPILYAKLLCLEEEDLIFSLFRTKGKKSIDPMDYFRKICKVKLALIIDSIYISETSVSIQVKVRECYVKPLPQIPYYKAFTFKPLLTIRDSDSDEETGELCFEWY